MSVAFDYPPPHKRHSCPGGNSTDEPTAKLPAVQDDAPCSQAAVEAALCDADGDMQRDRSSRSSSSERPHYSDSNGKRHQQADATAPTHPKSSTRPAPSSLDIHCWDISHYFSVDYSNNLFVSDVVGLLTECCLEMKLTAPQFSFYSKHSSTPVRHVTPVESSAHNSNRSRKRNSNGGWKVLRILERVTAFFGNLPDIIARAAVFASDEKVAGHLQRLDLLFFHFSGKAEKYSVAGALEQWRALLSGNEVFESVATAAGAAAVDMRSVPSSASTSTSTSTSTMLRTSLPPLFLLCAEPYPRSVAYLAHSNLSLAQDIVTPLQHDGVELQAAYHIQVAEQQPSTFSPTYPPTQPMTMLMRLPLNPANKDTFRLIVKGAAAYIPLPQPQPQPQPQVRRLSHLIRSHHTARQSAATLLSRVSLTSARVLSVCLSVCLPVRLLRTPSRGLWETTPRAMIRKPSYRTSRKITTLPGGTALSVDRSGRTRL